MAVASGMPCVYRTFLITPGIANSLAQVYPSKTALEKALIDTARIPLSQWAFANYWGNPGSAQDTSRYSLKRHEYRISKREGASITPVPPWLGWTNLGNLPTPHAVDKYGEAAQYSYR